MNRWIFLSLVVLSAPAFAQSVPVIRYESIPNAVRLPQNMYLGEAAGVAVNSKKHVFVFSRGNTTGPAFGASASQLLEFAPDGKYLREIGRNLYAWAFAHTVRIDKQDNIWTTDKGSDMVVKFNPEGRVDLVFGRKQEASDEAAPHKRGGPPPKHEDGRFRQPTDVAWDAAGNAFISDGYVNSRIAKVDRNGNWLKSWGERGDKPGEFNTPHSIATDAQGNVYVGDRGNGRIQVFDGDGNFKTQITNIGAPAAICITPGARPYLYSSNSNPPENIDVDGEIYKMDLRGKIVGKFGKAGKLPKEFGTVNAISCRADNELYVGEIGNWRVQKLTLH